LQSGRTVWLETGNLNAGLKHIVNEHAGDFARKGIPENRISAYIMTAFPMVTAIFCGLLL
jgi:filamentous hemagglutinin